MYLIPCCKSLKLALDDKTGNMVTAQVEGVITKRCHDKQPKLPVEKEGVPQKSHDKQPKLPIEKEGVSGDSLVPDLSKFQPEKLIYSTIKSRSEEGTPPWINTLDEDPDFNVAKFLADRLTRRSSMLKSVGVRPVRLGMSDESSVVAKVLRELMIVAERQIGHPFVPDTAKNTALQLEKDGQWRGDLSMGCCTLPQLSIGHNSKVAVGAGTTKKQIV
ncbi:hypothetical protein AgCh_002937 [Apium graveolens]